MMLEFRRVLAATQGRGWKRLLFDFFVLPLLVAIIMTSAFIARSSPGSQGDAFIFFGTLYAFWCGLFGSCQSFNGEVQSGEWSYWMLGMRRSVVSHYLAHFAVAFLCATAQVALSLVAIKGLWWLGAQISSLQGLFLNEGRPLVNQLGSLFGGGTAYNLKGLQLAMNAADVADGGPNLLWFHFCLRYYLGGVAMGIVSGVSIGLLVSAVCPTPQTSLNASVLLIVACTILSHTGIAGNSNDSGEVREFAPVRLILRQRGRQFRNAAETNLTDKAQARWQDGGVVEQLSFLLPQRYFFNIARIPRLKLESSLKTGWKTAETLLEHSTNSTDFCKCPVCLSLIRVSETNVVDGANYWIDDGNFHDFADNHWTQAGLAEGKWRKILFRNQSGEHMNESRDAFTDAINENRGGVKTLLLLCRQMALTEAACLTGWCLFYGIMAIHLLKQREMFHELR